MKIRPVLGFVVLSLLSLPLSAECDCAAAPCEELTLQSVAAREPESTGFGMEMTPVTSRHAPSGMAIEINSASSYSDAAFGLLILLCAPFVPIISLMRRLLASTGPLIELKIDRTAAAKIDVSTGEMDVRVRRVARVSPLGGRRLVPVLARPR